MKLRNRILSFLLVVCMLATLLPVSAMAMGTGKEELLQTSVPEAEEVQSTQTETDTQTDSGLVPQTQQSDTILDDETAKALAENLPEITGGVTVTAEETENPGLELKQNLSRFDETLNTATYAADETVRVIVVLEDKGLLEQGFSTAEISANATNVVRQVETLAQRQESVLQSINRIVEEPVEAKYRYNVAVSGLAVEIPYGDLEEIRALPGVETAFVAPCYDAPEDMTEETADPSMYAAKSTVGATQTWETLGYTGAGMRIAIIDSGLDTDHPAFAAAPELTEDSLTLAEVESLMKSLNAYELYMSHTAKELTADRLYRSEKVPFGFNYVDENLELNHDNASAGDHGSHVAGIAAANPVEGSDVVGVAPDAQILVMKVFGASGGAYFDDILAALEDCYRLNVDAVNLSLGSPSGFTNEDDYTDEIFGRILESDMIAAISAGNSFSAAYMNTYGTDRNLTCDPDIGILGSPGTYSGATMVASLENGYLMSNYFTVGDTKITYNDAAALPFTDLAGEALGYVLVPGYGEGEDYAGLDVAGKIAVVSRGQLSFVEKQQNAADRGAIALIVYDNTEAALGYMQDAGVLPNVIITKANGEILKAQAVDGQGTLTVHAADDLTTVESDTAGRMSEFSSWGVTPDLQLMPDITAPGGNIYSTVDGGGYGTKSGTSMASPAVAGMSALILQYLRDKYDLYDSQAHTVAEALLMSTAEPVVEDTGVLYSPRKQGAGSANVYQAITSPAYLTVNGDTPKVSFGDDDNRTGVYRFSFEVNNLTDEALTYALDGSALTDQVDLTYAAYGYTFMGETSRNLNATVEFSLKNGELPLQYDYNADGETGMDDVQALLDAVNGLAEVKSGYDLNRDGKTDTADAQALYELVSAGFVPQTLVEVPANGSVRVHVTVTLSEDDKAYMDRYYENGIYVDGFVRLYAQNGNTVDLSLPFMGFYGDWSDARVFDSGWYTSDDVEFNRYYSVFFTEISGQDFVLGWNPYIEEEYDPSHNVLSPNNDGAQDSITEIYLSLMRNVKYMGFTWSNAKTGSTVFQTAAQYVRKSFYYAAYNLCLPFIVSQYCRLYNFKGLANNTELELTIDAYLDDGDNVADETYTMPVYIDTEAPVLHADSLVYDYDPDTDTRKLSFEVSDNHGIAAVIPLTDGNGVYDRISVDAAPGERARIELDVTDYDATFTIAVCDYGCNESYYKISFFGKDNVDFDSFYGYRCYASVPVDGGIYGTGMYNGFVSFETGEEMFQHTSQLRSGEADVYAAEYIDGYIIGIDSDSNIFTMRAGDWSRTVIGKLEIDGTVYPALDMAFDYTTDTLFVLTDEARSYTGGHLVTVDYITGEVTDIGVVTDDRPYSDQGVTLACDNEGVLYTVYYLSGNGCDAGALYTIDKETAYATRVGDTGLMPEYVQSMTVDHKTDKLYWASYQSNSGAFQTGIEENCLYEVNKTTGELTLVSAFQYNDEITGLFKPYRPEKSLFPEDAPLTELRLSRDELTLVAGKTADLTCRPWPYYAELGEVTWTSSNVSVATVEDGRVTAVAQGEAIITASVGELSVECQVSVKSFSGELRLYNTVGGEWISVDVSDPGSTQVIENAASFPYGFLTAAYYDGNLCVTDYLGGFYRLDGETIQGVSTGTAGASLKGIAFNYQDGFLYGVAGAWLYRVNPYSGAVTQVHMFGTSNFGNPLGGFASDYEGNFYCIAQGYNGEGTMLHKFHLENGKVVDWQKTYMPQYPIQMYNCSLTYSAENGGLFWANDMGQLLWIDASDMDHLRIAELGTIGDTTGGGTLAMNTCLYEIPEKEPEVPYAPLSGAAMDGSFTLLVGGSTRVGLSGTPWNAKLEATYSVDDTSVAVVNQAGELTGVAAGETTLRVSVKGLAEPLTASVQVLESAGEIYGYMLGNYLYDWGKWIRFEDYNTGTIDRLSSTPGFFQVRAGAYYDGSIYTYCATEQDENWKRSIVKFDAGDYTRETLKFSDYQIRDMEFDYTTGTMYAVAERIAANAASNYALIQVDIETGDEVLVGSTGQDLVAMTVDNLGRIFGINQKGYLCQVDKETGAATLIGYTGVSTSSVWQSMHYDYNTGNTYWAQPGEMGQLRIIDLETGASTPIGVIEKMGMQMSAMFTIPEEDPAMPETVEPTGVSLDEKNTVVVGSTVALTSHVLPLTVCAMDETLTWASSDETVATVDNGVVTGISAGTVTITATTVNGITAECTVVVTENERRFYAYDEDNRQWISFTADDPGDVTVERKDAEDETLISASTLVEDTIYAFDFDGRFFTIDPDTFERTLVSDALVGTTYSYYLSGEGYLYCKRMPVDMSYDAATGTLYVVMQGYVDKAENVDMNGMRPLISLVYSVDMGTGDIKLRCLNDTVIFGNLMVENGRVFFVNAFLSGMFSYIDLSDWRWTVVQQGLVVDYWGLYMQGRSMIRDEYTGTVYSIWDESDIPGDNSGGHSQLVILNTNNPDITKLGLIGDGIVLNSLFIR